MHVCMEGGSRSKGCSFYHTTASYQNWSVFNRKLDELWHVMYKLSSKILIYLYALLKLFLYYIKTILFFFSFLDLGGIFKLLIIL